MSQSPEYGAGYPDPLTQDQFARAEEIIARDDAQRQRALVRYIIPLTVVKLALTGAYIYMEGGLHSPHEAAAETTYSCTDFTPDVLDPPTTDKFGFNNPGKKLDGRQITSDNMQPLLDPLTKEPVMKADGNPVKMKTLGNIHKDGDKLGGDLSGLPGDYVRSWLGVVQVDEVRWSICHMAGGVSLVATDTDYYRNAHYDGEKEGTEFTFMAGEQDDLFNETRDLAYTQVHEGGHFLRHQIMSGHDERSQELIKRIDSLYEQHLSMALEEYRVKHGQQILEDLAGIESQFTALDASVTDAATKQTVKRGIEYLRQKLAEPGGLGEIGIETFTDPENNAGEVQLASLDNMLAIAFEATAKDGESRLYGLGEYFEDYPDKLDGELMTRTYKQIKEFLIPRFLSEEVLPGNEGGHSWEDSNELFATSWVLAGQASANRYEQVVGGLPEEYRPIARQQLETAAELRRTIDPTQPLGE